MNEEYSQDRGLLFMRHGETTANLAMIASGGDRDPELTDVGREQAREAVLTLRRYGLKPNLIITSSAKRTLNTAEIINERLRLECVIDDALLERFLGDWNDVRSEIVNPMMIAGETPPNGESRAEFRHRIMQFFRENSAQFKRWPLVIGNRGTARILLETVNAKDAAFFPNGKLLKIALADSDDFQVIKIDRL